ncbi:MAG: flagellar hook-length control protein FliK [Spirochaetaceae bacterium]|nr:MAG: flagellar hook-length control protein FliK [Spirochaetaceae bacterium]
MIQLHAERSPTLLDLSPQTSAMLSKHDGSAGFAEYLDKMLGRGVFSSPLQNKTLDVSHEPASFAVPNDDRSQYEVDQYSDKRGEEPHSNVSAHEDDEAAEKLRASKAEARKAEVSRSEAVSKTPADESGRKAADDSSKGEAVTEQSDAKFKAAASFAQALDTKNSTEWQITKEGEARADREKATSSLRAAKSSADHDTLKSMHADSELKAESGFEARPVTEGKSAEAGQQEMLGQKQLFVADDSTKEASAQDSGKQHSRQAQGAVAESFANTNSQDAEETEKVKLSAAKTPSESRNETDTARLVRNEHKADVVTRESLNGNRDDKLDRVAAGAIAADKHDGDSGRSRSRVRPEIVVDLSKYDTTSESDKAGSKQFGGESRGGEQDGRNSFSTRLDGFGGTDSASGRNGTLGSDFASQLSRRLQGDAGAEIVRHAHMVVRGKESGEMRLVLRPDHLGSVRVRMQMEDGLITVRFLVENNGVRQALEQNLAGLQQAFKDAGLETGSLDVSVGNGGNGDAEQQGQGDTARREVHRLAAAVPGISEFGFPEHAVDLIA